MEASFEQNLELPEWWPEDENGVKFGESFLDAPLPDEFSNDIPNDSELDALALTREKLEESLRTKSSVESLVAESLALAGQVALHKPWCAKTPGGVEFFAKKLHRQTLMAVLTRWVADPLRVDGNPEVVLQNAHLAFLDDLGALVEELSWKDGFQYGGEWQKEVNVSLEIELEAMARECSKLSLDLALESRKSVAAEMLQGASLRLGTMEVIHSWDEPLFQKSPSFNSPTSDKPHVDEAKDASQTTPTPDALRVNFKATWARWKSEGRKPKASFVIDRAGVPKASFYRWLNKGETLSAVNCAALDAAIRAGYPAIEAHPINAKKFQRAA